MRNIFLTGFMGAGKSTVGKILAQKLDWTFVDTDRALEKKTGVMISELFEAGEDSFRKLEGEMVCEVLKTEKQVVALGGGSLIKSSTRLQVLGAGQLVYLKAQSKTLAERLKTARDVRPLLAKQSDKEAFIEALLKERDNVYQAAHHTVVTDRKTPEIIAAEIMNLIGQLLR